MNSEQQQATGAGMATALPPPPRSAAQGNAHDPWLYGQPGPPIPPPQPPPHHHHPHHLHASSPSFQSSVPNIPPPPSRCRSQPPDGHIFSPHHFTSHSVPLPTDHHDQHLPNVSQMSSAASVGPPSSFPSGASLRSPFSSPAPQDDSSRSDSPAIMKNRPEHDSDVMFPRRLPPHPHMPNWDHFPPPPPQNSQPPPNIDLQNYPPNNFPPVPNSDGKMDIPHRLPPYPGTVPFTPGHQIPPNVSLDAPPMHPFGAPQYATGAKCPPRLPGMRMMYPANGLGKTEADSTQEHGHLGHNGLTENSFQVPSISSTTPPQRQMKPLIEPVIPVVKKCYKKKKDDGNGEVKIKKRKRCGECAGCQLKENCGECGPCKSVRSHQICKLRKCDHLKSKKSKKKDRGDVDGIDDDIFGDQEGTDSHYFGDGPATPTSNPSNAAPHHLPAGPNMYPNHGFGQYPHMNENIPNGPPNGPVPPSQNMFSGMHENFQGYHGPPSMTSPAHINGTFDPNHENAQDPHQAMNSKLKNIIHNRQNFKEQQLSMQRNSEPPMSWQPSRDFHNSPHNPPTQQHPPHQHNTPPMTSMSGPVQVPPHPPMVHHRTPPPRPPSSTALPPTHSIPRQTPPPPSVTPNGNSHQPVTPTSMPTPPPSVTPNSMPPIPSPEVTPTSNYDSSSISTPPGSENIPVSEQQQTQQPPLQQQTPQFMPQPNDAPKQTFCPTDDGSHQKPNCVSNNSQENSPSLHNKDSIIKSPPVPKDPLHTQSNGMSPFHNNNSSNEVMTKTPTATVVEGGDGANNNIGYHPHPSKAVETLEQPFLLNTTTSMSTYTSTTSTYSMPITSMPQTHMYYSGQQLQHDQMAAVTLSGTPGAPAVPPSNIDCGRIQSYFTNGGNGGTAVLPPASSSSSVPLFRMPSIMDKDKLSAAAAIEGYLPNHYHHAPAPPLPSFPSISSFDYSFSNNAAISDLNNDDWLERMERLRNNTKMQVPNCDCISAEQSVDGEGPPYYTHLGSGPSVPAIRAQMEKRFGVEGKSIRIEKITYTGKEGKTSQGCPMAKWILRRSGLEEKHMVVVRNRFGHKCQTAWIVVIIVAWEGVQDKMANSLYDLLINKVNNYGLITQRRCGFNEMRTCACQGVDPEVAGGSYSFGCSWSMYYNGCKFARSTNARKFKLTDEKEEEELEDNLQTLATYLSPVYKQLVPDSYGNQVEFEAEGEECRLGREAGKPFSGVTSCVDFCTHAHKDIHNMNNGCTVVVTLTKHRGLSKPDDEQLHVLPLYVLSDTDEHGSREMQDKKIEDGAIERLSRYSIKLRIRSVPASPCKVNRTKKKAGENTPSPRRKWKRRRSLDSILPPFQENVPQPLPNHPRKSLEFDSTPVTSMGNIDFAHHVSNIIQQTQKSLSHNMKNEHGVRNPTPSPSYSYKSFKRSQGNSNVAVKMETSYDFEDECPVAKIPVSPSFTNHNVNKTLGPDYWPTSARSQSQDTKTGLLYPNLTAGDQDITCDKVIAKGSVYPTSSHTYNSTTYASGSNYQQKLNHTSYQQPYYLSQPGISPYSAPSMPPNDVSDRYGGYLKSSVSSPSTLSNNGATSHLPLKSQSSASYTSSHFQHALPSLAPPTLPNFAYHPRYPPHSPSPNPIVHPKHPPTSSHFDLYRQPLPESSIAPKSNSGSHFAFNSAEMLPSFGKTFLNSPPMPQSSYYAPVPPSANDNRSIYAGVMGTNDECDYSPIKSMKKKQDHPYVTGLSSDDMALPRYYEVESESEENFRDSQIGGVAIALGHGSVLFECAKHELHATTALKNPDRRFPKRISLVFYQHKNLNTRNHGYQEWIMKKEEKQKEKAKKEAEAAAAAEVAAKANQAQATPNTYNGLPYPQSFKQEAGVRSSVGNLGMPQFSMANEHLGLAEAATKASWTQALPNGYAGMPPYTRIKQEVGGQIPTGDVGLPQFSSANENAEQKVCQAVPSSNVCQQRALPLRPMETFGMPQQTIKQEFGTFGSVPVSYPQVKQEVGTSICEQPNIAVPRFSRANDYLGQQVCQSMPSSYQGALPSRSMPAYNNLPQQTMKQQVNARMVNGIPTSNSPLQRSPLPPGTTQAHVSRNETSFYNSVLSHRGALQSGPMEEYGSRMANSAPTLNNSHQRLPLPSYGIRQPQQQQIKQEFGVRTVPSSNDPQSRVLPSMHSFAMPRMQQYENAYAAQMMSPQLSTNPVHRSLPCTINSHPTPFNSFKTPSLHPTSTSHYTMPGGMKYTSNGTIMDPQPGGAVYSQVPTMAQPGAVKFGMKVPGDYMGVPSSMYPYSRQVPLPPLMQTFMAPRSVGGAAFNSYIPPSQGSVVANNPMEISTTRPNITRLSPNH